MYVAFDTETALIRPAAMAPELVCMTWCDEGLEPGIALAQGASAAFRGLAEGGAVFIGHNVAFDCAVLAAHDPALLPLLFQLYAGNRILDTQLAEQLGDLATRGSFSQAKGYYTLGGCVGRRLGEDRSAEKAAGAWRYRYAELLGVPLELWPEEAIKYPKQDASDTLRLFLSQGYANMKELAHQARKAFALKLSETWGVRTDAAMVEGLEATYRAIVVETNKALLVSGIIRPDGSQNMLATALAVEAAVAAPQKTATGKVSCSREALEAAVAAGSTVLAPLVDSLEARDFLSDWLPRLQAGAHQPLHTQYRTLLTTGRTSSSPNLQNPPRKGPVRECFIPRPGNVFVSVDYNQVELCALAEVCLTRYGQSKMADDINAGVDLHSRLGAKLAGVSYEDFRVGLKAGNKHYAAMRQVSKPVNFGYPGGMGPDRMVQTVKDQAGMVVSREDAAAYRQAWLDSFPEMAQYFRDANHVAQRGGGVVQFGHGRRRADCSYCEVCNTYFQGLVADGAAEALFAVSAECYTKPESPLYGTHIALFLHDEILLEVEEWRAPEAAERLAVVMVAAMKRWIRKVKVSAEPAIMRRWYKGTKEVRDSAGRLLPWEPPQVP